MEELGQGPRFPAWPVEELGRGPHSPAVSVEELGQTVPHSPALLPRASAESVGASLPLAGSCLRPPWRAFGVPQTVPQAISAQPEVGGGERTSMVASPALVGGQVGGPGGPRAGPGRAQDLVAASELVEKNPFGRLGHVVRRVHRRKGLFRLIPGHN